MINPEFLPDEPSPPPHCLRKLFLLLEDDMDIFSDHKNEKLWGSEWVTHELLDAFYTVTTELVLADSTKPANSPFSRDGKVAFVDTQHFYRKQMKYYKLTSYLSPSMRVYWENLIENGKNQN